MLTVASLALSNQPRGSRLQSTAGDVGLSLKWLLYGQQLALGMKSHQNKCIIFTFCAQVLLFSEAGGNGWVREWVSNGRCERASVTSELEQTRPSPNADVLLNVHIHEIYDLMDCRSHASRSLLGLFNVVKSWKDQAESYSQVQWFSKLILVSEATSGSYLIHGCVWWLGCWIPIGKVLCSYPSFLFPRLPEGIPEQDAITPTLSLMTCI